jgi:hypothetical protein
MAWMPAYIAVSNLRSTVYGINATDFYQLKYGYYIKQFTWSASLPYSVNARAEDTVKGTVSRDFRPLVFFGKQYPLVP